jgi:hypothetical protein
LYAAGFKESETKMVEEEDDEENVDENDLLEFIS